MKILFLDFDGVLNHNEWMFANNKTYHKNPLNPAAVEILNHIVGLVPNLKIVISSAWRLDGLMACRKHLRRAGFVDSDIVIACTGQDLFGRGQEIADWINGPGLHERGGVTHYVILDDDVFDMGDQLHKVVHTPASTGLTLDHVPAILKHLEG